MPPLARLLSLIVAIGLLLPAAASAAPSFQVQLTPDMSEVQLVTVRATAGQYRLTFDGDTTVDLAFNSPTATVQAALNALPSVSAGGGSVSMLQTSNSTGEYGIRFDGGPLANTDVPQITVAKGTTPLSGNLRKVLVSTIFHAGFGRSDERLDYALEVKNTGADPTAGSVTAEVELPGGLQTSVLKFFDPQSLAVSPAGWTCSAQPASGVQPAKATCTRSDPLAPGSSYPGIGVAAHLGADAPDHAVATAMVSGGGAVAASGDAEFDFGPTTPFGIDAFDSEVSDSEADDYTQAGGHPFSGSENFTLRTYRADIASISIASIPTEPVAFPSGHPKSVIADLPRGFVGNALAVPEICPTTNDVLESTCPPGSAVGQITLFPTIGSNFGPISNIPIYSIEPEFGTAAQFAFAETALTQSAFTISPQLRADDGYAITLVATPAPTLYPLRSVPDVTLCSFGAKVTANNKFISCKEAGEPDPDGAGPLSGANPVPLVTNPTRCSGTPPTPRLRINSWEHLGDFVSAESVDPLPSGCDLVPFEPKVSLEPTSSEADSPTGVNVEITMPTEGLLDPEGTSQAMLDNATVTFPEGMSINPAASHGLGACTPAQLKFHSNAEDECPESSKVGTVEVETPIVRGTLTGDVYVAAQRDNPFNSTLGLYLVFDSKKDGVIVKVAGKLETDPVTGQLTSVFTENPEWPFSRVSLRFPQGPRAPLITPPRCGSYEIHSELSPWSAASPANPTPEEIVAEDSTYEVTSGPGGGPCPSGALEPRFDAGLQNAQAGAKSPFVLKLSREDGSQRFAALDVSMPPGLTAYLKGTPYCPDNVLAGISGAELAGRAELAGPACPAASQIGAVQAGAGAGPFPFYATGRAYLAGPYKGAPLSIAIVTPAVAGPFDLGNVVVRNALYVDPVSSQVSVKSDPIPTILHGILLDLRDIRVNIDRPGFTAAPTNCEAKTIGARIGGELGASVARSNHFQVGDCAALGFKPKLALRLFGGTHRGAHPRLRATLTARQGDANIAGASVALPHSEFLDQAHIRTVCTRPQFAADACPAAAVYGHAEAVTPLLDSPLSGPVYLRSSSNLLPDLVAVLRGPDTQPIEVVLDGRVDSVHGGIRTSFEAVPDQPVSTFTLSMQGGKKGLLVNSRDVCKSVNKVTAKFTAQNGKRAELRPVLQNSCKKVASKHKKHRGRKSGR